MPDRFETRLKSTVSTAPAVTIALSACSIRLVFLPRG
jgi:hypothetical protein